MHTGQELQPIIPHQLGVWYEKAAPASQWEGGIPRTFRFMLLAPAARGYQDGRHFSTGVVILDGARVYTAPLTWHPESVRLYPGWWRRQWEKLVGNPLLRSALLRSAPGDGAAVAPEGKVAS